MNIFLAFLVFLPLIASAQPYQACNTHEICDPICFAGQPGECSGSNIPTQPISCCPGYGSGSLFCDNWVCTCSYIPNCSNTPTPPPLPPPVINYTYFWGHEFWSECSEDCGPGTETRIVYCLKKNVNFPYDQDETTNSDCINSSSAGPMIPTIQSCNSQNCSAPVVPSNYSAPSSFNSNWQLVVIVLSVLFGIIFFSMIVLYFYRRKQRLSLETNQQLLSPKNNSIPIYVV